MINGKKDNSGSVFALDANLKENNKRIMKKIILNPAKTFESSDNAYKRAFRKTICKWYDLGK